MALQNMVPIFVPRFLGGLMKRVHVRDFRGLLDDLRGLLNLPNRSRRCWNVFHRCPFVIAGNRCPLPKSATKGKSRFVLRTASGICRVGGAHSDLALCVFCLAGHERQDLETHIGKPGHFRRGGNRDALIRRAPSRLVPLGLATWPPSRPPLADAQEGESRATQPERSHAGATTSATRETPLRRLAYPRTPARLSPGHHSRRGSLRHPLRRSGLSPKAGPACARPTA